MEEKSNIQQSVFKDVLEYVSLPVEMWGEVWRGKALREKGFIIPPQKHEGRGVVFQKYTLFCGAW